MKRLWKICKYTGIALAALLALDLGVILFFAYYHPPVPKADAIIILGAAINTPALYNRSLEGLKLYQAGKAPVLVLSGGVDYPRSMSEAQYMENIILEHSSGVPNIIMEPRSNSTFENIINSKQLIPEARSVIIVSDTYHLARGVIMARAAGFKPVYWDAPETASYYPWDELLFHYLREAVAMVDYVPKFVVGSK